MKRITTVVALLISSAINAQDTLIVSLSDAIQYSLSNNKTLQAEQLNTQLNEYRLKEVSSALIPTINANAGITHYIDIPQQYVAANALSPAAPSDQYVRLELLLPNSFSAGIAVNWTLYDQAVYSARKILSLQREQSDIRVEKNKSDLGFTVSQLYYGIIFLQKQQEVLFKVSANADKLINILQRNHDNGLIKRSDLEKAQVSKVNITSQMDGLKTALETQNRLLRLMMGVPATTAVRLSESDFKGSLVPITTPNLGIERTIDFQLMQREVRLSVLERKAILASYLPTLGLMYSYSHNAVSPEFKDVLSSSFSYPTQFVGINLSVPVFDGNRNIYRLKQNSVRHRQLDLQSQFLSEKLTTEIENSHLQYSASLRTIASNEANTTLAEKLYSQSILEYQHGTITLSDVLTAENSLQQTLTAYFNSVSTALVALLEYKRVTNTIFE